MTEVPQLTLGSIRSAYERGYSPVAIVDQVFARIAEVGDPGIFIHLLSKEEVVSAARALGAYDPHKPLWGVPFVIKDNIDFAGKPTTAGCPDFEYMAEKSAIVVENLIAAGALLIGKTNLDQFATGLVGVRSPYQIPKNALDPNIVPGGSSSGSAVAVSHGIVAFSLGTDTAGSGRVPAALNNIVGLKPTLGALSASGVVPACRTLDTVSIFAQTVDDAYTVFKAAASFDPEDSYSRRIEIPPITAAPDHPAIGIPSPESIRFEGDAEQKEAFEAVIADLKSHGATVNEIDFTPLYEIAQMLYYGPWVAERYVATEQITAVSPTSLFPVTRKIIEGAKNQSTVDAFKAFYRLKDLVRVVEQSIRACDALCVPSIPTFFSLDALEADPITPNNALGTYTNFVNLMDMCGIAVPAPPRKDGRPGGVTFLGQTGEDAKVAALARHVERMGSRTLGATNWPRPVHAKETSKIPAPQISETIQIAVCGAHMDGLPLNSHLTSRGASKVAETKTAGDYGFYALPGDGVARPALIRREKGKGAAVSLEIWDMPEAEFGSFMKTIPAPFGIGTIKLADGETVQGFLCEAIAAEGATDITHLADWRLYLAQGTQELAV
ncbi:MAG: allophanate hydrolase [Pseudomonadota bacterium]